MSAIAPPELTLNDCDMLVAVTLVLDAQLLAYVVVAANIMRAGSTTMQPQLPPASTPAIHLLLLLLLLLLPPAPPPPPPPPPPPTTTTTTSPTPTPTCTNIYCYYCYCTCTAAASVAAAAASTKSCHRCHHDDNDHNGEAALATTVPAKEPARSPPLPTPSLVPTSP